VLSRRKPRVPWEAVGKDRHINPFNGGITRILATAAARVVINKEPCEMLAFVPYSPQPSGS